MTTQSPETIAAQISEEMSGHVLKWNRDICELIISKHLEAALSQVESEALASKVVSEPELEIRKSLLRRIEYLESQLAPKEPEVKAQGFEEWWSRQCYKETFLITDGKHETFAREVWQAAFLAGQKSKAATLKLPEKKDTNWDNFVERSESTELAFNEGYNAAIDDMRKLNGLENV